jgi:hypothetical protein
LLPQRSAQTAVASGHTLPSGRYSLLGPDLHRLDRTSLRLAHSFDDLVGGSEERRRHLKAECLGGLLINDELEPGRLQYGQVTRLFALEYPTDVNAAESALTGGPRPAGAKQRIGDLSHPHWVPVRTGDANVASGLRRENQRIIDEMLSGQI